VILPAVEVGAYSVGGAVFVALPVYLIVEENRIDMTVQVSPMASYHH